MLIKHKLIIVNLHRCMGGDLCNLSRKIRVFISCLPREIEISRLLYEGNKKM